MSENLDFGITVGETVKRTGVSKPMVTGWKRRYANEGHAGLGNPAEAGPSPLG